MEFNLTTFRNILNDNRFIPLGGSLNNLGELVVNRSYISKLLYSYKQPVAGVWGTLGWENDQPFNPTGTIALSEEGNHDSGGDNAPISNEMKLIQSVNPEISDTGQIRERYINLNDVDFDALLPETFRMDEIPVLRLTLFLQPTEGAIVYYQHSDVKNNSDEDAALEYILHEAADSHRDRLTYNFPVELKNALEIVDEEKQLVRKTTTPTNKSFIIKILTFNQPADDDQAIFESQVRHVNTPLLRKKKLNYYLNISAQKTSATTPRLLGKEKYALLLFNPAATEETPGGYMEEVSDAIQINPAARTLLLIHGTISDTAKSFADLLVFQENKGASTLQHLIATGCFEQIIALDHPTMTQSPDENVAWLIDRLQVLGITLTNPIDIVTTSRGSLVAECMVSNENMKAHFPAIKRIMMFSANGCGYFRILHRIESFLSICREIWPDSAVFTIIAQLGIDWLINQPGLKALDTERPVLWEILERQAVYENVIYKNIASDWNKCLADGLFKRWSLTTADIAIRLALGKQHDYVIGFDQQKRIPGGFNDNLEFRTSAHGKYLRNGYVRDEELDLMTEPHEIFWRFFHNESEPVINN